MDNQKNILFVSTLCSDKVFDYISNTSSKKSGHSIQKFHSLIIQGLAIQKSNVVELFSSLPIAYKSHKKRLWRIKKEKSGNVNYNYIPTINLPFLKNFIVFFYSFFHVLFWRFPARKEQHIMIADILKISIVLGAFFACKIRGIKSIAIVTDLPKLVVSENERFKSLRDLITGFMTTRFDGYILITKQMNEVVNPSKKPHLIMEGIADSTMMNLNNQIQNKTKEKILLYSGGIYERYGVVKLIEAFKLIDDEEARLHIYGEGPMEKEMPFLIKSDMRIKYFGVVSNDIIVHKQQEATLLINPRPTFEDFTKFSFPGKNMEYMASGTPVVTTKLPGMPEEYYPFVYLFHDESEEGMALTLKSLLNKPRIELHNFGNIAKEFVLTYKNNITQANNISELINIILSR